MNPNKLTVSKKASSPDRSSFSRFMRPSGIVLIGFGKPFDPVVISISSSSMSTISTSKSSIEFSMSLLLALINGNIGFESTSPA